MLTRSLVLMTLLVLATAAVGGDSALAASEVRPSEGVVRKVLENGVTILVKESKANEVVSVQLIMSMGAKLESDRESGISKLLQRSVLKGTKTRGAEQIANEIESVGGRIESGTTKEAGYVRFTCTTEGLEKAQEVFFDIILNPVFPADEVEKERALIIQAIQQRKDQLLASTIDLAQEVLYAEHPFHKPGDGYEETVSSFTRTDVVGAYERFYRPENMIIVAVGNLDGKKFSKDVTKAFGTRKSGGARPPLELPGVNLSESREKFNHKRSSSAWLVIAFPTPGAAQDDYLPARVLDSVLGGSLHSRLFTELRDKRGLGYQVGSFFANYSRDAFVGAYIGTRPDQFDTARNGILNEIEKIRTERVSDEELNDTKTFLRGSYIISLESNENQAYNFGYYECVGVGYDYGDRYLDGLKGVTKEDVLRVAEKYFGAYALASTLPEKTETGEAGR